MCPGLFLAARGHLDSVTINLDGLGLKDPVATEYWPLVKIWSKSWPDYRAAELSWAHLSGSALDCWLANGWLDSVAAVVSQC